MYITIRKFEREDIPNKVKWINDPANNQFLHYDLPIEISKTQRWFDNNVGRTDRYDAVIEADGMACGIIGLLGIDKRNSKAEYYVTMGEASLKGRGIATEASKIILEYAFKDLNLNKVFLYTETENIAAQKFFEHIGFKREGVIRQDLYSRERFVDRIMYGMLKNDFENIMGNIT